MIEKKTAVLIVTIKNQHSFLHKMQYSQIRNFCSYLPAEKRKTAAVYADPTSGKPLINLIYQIIFPENSYVFF